MIVLPPATSRGLARASGSLALSLARRAVLALIRREPGALLTVGFGAGLLARAASAGLLRSAFSRPPAPRSLDLLVETITIQRVQVSERG
jgi:hypothetical protein